MLISNLLYAIEGRRNRVGEVLINMADERRFMEVEIENIKVAIKLKFALRKKSK